MPIVPSRSEEIQRLVAELAAESGAARESAVARLTLVGERAVPSLAAALGTAPARGRLAALRVLERLPASRALGEVLALLHDPDPDVAARAARLAAAYPGALSLRALAEALRSPRAHVRREAVAALGMTVAAGSVEAIDALLGVVLDERAEESLRLAAVDALRTLAPRELGPVLERLRAGGSAELVRRAEALVRGESAPPAGVSAEVSRLLSDLPAGPEAIPTLHRALAGLTDRNREGADADALAEAKSRLHAALAARGSRIALYDLREMLEARPRRSAEALLESAARIGDATFVPALARLVADSPPLVEACARVLREIVARGKLRKTSRAVRAVRPEHRPAFEALWARARS